MNTRGVHDRDGPSKDDTATPAIRVCPASFGYSATVCSRDGCAPDCQSRNYSQPWSTDAIPDDVIVSDGVPSLASVSDATSHKSPVCTSGADASATSAPS